MRGSAFHQGVSPRNVTWNPWRVSCDTDTTEWRRSWEYKTPSNKYSCPAAAIYLQRAAPGGRGHGRTTGHDVKVREICAVIARQHGDGGA
jgi:hypothetical protein